MADAHPILKEFMYDFCPTELALLDFQKPKGKDWHNFAHESSRVRSSQPRTSPTRALASVMSVDAL